MSKVWKYFLFFPAFLGKEKEKNLGESFPIRMTLRTTALYSCTRHETAVLKGVNAIKQKRLADRDPSL